MNVQVTSNPETSYSEIISFCRLLSAACKSGLPLAIALEKARGDRVNSAVTNWAKQLESKLKNGYSVEEAVSTLKGFDPVLARLMPLLGKERLIEVFDVYTLCMIKQEMCNNQIRSMLWYPLVIMCIVCFSMLYLNFFTFPYMEEMGGFRGGFENWSFHLLYFANIGYWPFSLIVPGAIVYLLLDCFIAFSRGRFISSSVFGRFTGFNKALQIAEKARTAAMLSLYISAGYTLQNAIETVANFIEDRNRRELLDMHRALTLGNSFSDSLKKSDLIAEIVNGKESIEELGEKFRHAHDGLNSEAMSIISKVSDNAFYISILLVALAVLAVSSGIFGSNIMLARSFM